MVRRKMPSGKLPPGNWPPGNLHPKKNTLTENILWNLSLTLFLLKFLNCLNKNICFIKKIHLVKIHLKSSLLWKLSNMATFTTITSLYEGSEQSTKTGKLSPTFSCRRELLEKLVVSQVEMRKVLILSFTCVWFLNLASLLIIFRVQISEYSFNSFFKTDLLTLPTQPDDLPFYFISPSLPVRT